MGQPKTYYGDRYDLADLGLLDGRPEREFDVVTRLAMNLLHCDQGIFVVRDHISASFYVRASGVRGTGHPLPRNACGADSPFSEVTDSNAIVAIENLDTSYPGFADHARGMAMMSFLGAPVHGVLGEPIGVLAVTCGVPRVWSVADRRELRDLAFLLQRNVLLRAALETVKRISKEAIMPEPVMGRRH